MRPLSLLAPLSIVLACTPLLLGWRTPAPQQSLQEVHRPRTWLVDVLGGGDFTDLPPCVRAASPGDVVRVAGGFYNGVELRGKGLTILGDGALPGILGGVVVRDLPAGQQVVLRSLSLRSGLPILDLMDNAGTVWIEECEVGLGNGMEVSLRVQDCDAVVLDRCSVEGPGGGPAPQYGLYALRSNVHAFDTTFRGGHGFLSFPEPIPGGIGAGLDESFFYAAGCTFQGGAGSLATCLGGFSSNCVRGGSGGPGLQVLPSDPVSEVYTLTCSFTGGSGGSSTTCNLDHSHCPGGSSSQAIVGSITQIPIPLRSFDVDSPVQPGGTYHVEASCQPGESVWSSWSAGVAPQYAPLYFGPQLNAAPVTLVFEGVADATGSLAKDVPVPPTLPLIPFGVSFVQGLFFDSLGNAFLGSGSVLVAVD